LQARLAGNKKPARKAGYWWHRILNVIRANRRA
jgi:hypothetical protein